MISICCDGRWRCADRHRKNNLEAFHQISVFFFFLLLVSLFRLLVLVILLLLLIFLVLVLRVLVLFLVVAVLLLFLFFFLFFLLLLLLPLIFADMSASCDVSRYQTVKPLNGNENLGRWEKGEKKREVLGRGLQTWTRVGMGWVG